MKTVASVNNAILSGNFSMEELRSIGEALSVAYDRGQRTAKLYFSRGDKVYFDSTKTGERIHGTITKINQKTIELRTDRGNSWKVSASLLKKA